MSTRWSAATGHCARHNEPGCPSCLKYDLNDERAKVAKLRSAMRDLLEVTKRGNMNAHEYDAASRALSETEGQ